MTMRRQTPRHQTLPAAGFSLIELMVAMAISGIVVASATSAMLMIFRATSRAEQQADADENAKLLLDHLLGKVQQVGGGSVRPSMAIRIDDNCTTTLEVGDTTLPACDESDRIHFLEIDDSIPECTITTFNGVTPSSMHRVDVA